MAFSFDDITYPQYLDIGDMTGGYDYQFYRSGGSVNTRWFKLGTVFKHNIADNFDPMVHDYSEPFNDGGVICSLPNGYSIHFCYRFYAQSGDAIVYVTLEPHMFDENNNDLGRIWNIEGVSAASSNFSIYSADMRSYAYTVPYSVAIFCNTEYYPASPDDAVHPTSLEIRYLTANGIGVDVYDSGGVNLGSWTDGALVNLYDNFTHIVGFPVQQSATSPLVSFTAEGIDNFNNWLHNRGNPFEGNAIVVPTVPDVPAGGNDTSVPGGGGGNYDSTSDPVDFPDLPTGGAIESGAVIAHRVSKQSLEVIFTKLWNKSLIDITNIWQKSIQDPMDAIVSLHALPVSPEVVDDPNNIAIGNLDMGVSTPLVTSQYVAVDCGTLNVREFWGSALDYSPYTRVEIFLPFIGIRTLRTEDVMKSTLHIKYHVDVLSGDCIAFIKCGISVLYTYNGNCKMLIPLSSRSTDFLQKAAITAGLAVGAGAVAVGGGAAAAAATKAPAVAAAGITQSAANLQAGSMLLSGASTVASTKINTQRSGDISSALSLMADFVPYLIIHRPVQSLAKDYNKFKGYTSNITAKLGNLTGYTEVEHVHLQNIPNATDAELAEIHSLLVGGVII